MASAVLAWVHIRSTSIWYDEGLTLLITAGHGKLEWSLGMDQFKPTVNLFKILSQLYIYDVHPPLYFWTLAIWRVLLGRSLEVARMLSAVFTLGTTALIYRYAVTLRLRWPFIPAVIYAASAAGMRYAYNARPYAMATFLIVLTLYLAQRKSNWTGACAAACMATHYFAGLCVGSIIGVEFLLSWKSNRRWSIWAATSFLISCLPLAVLVTRHISARPQQFPGFGNFRKELDTVLGGALRGGLPSSTLDAYWKYVLLAGGVLALVGAIYAIRRKVVTVPIVYAAFLFSFFLTAIATNKSAGKMPIDYYLGVSSPLFALLLWFAIDYIPLVAGTMIGLIVLVGTATATPMMAPRDYRKIVTKIRSDCDRCAILVSGMGAAVPACTLYEAQGLDVYLLTPDDVPENLIRKIGENRVIYFVPADEPFAVQMENKFVHAVDAKPEDDFFRIDPSHLYSATQETDTGSSR